MAVDNFTFRDCSTSLFQLGNPSPFSVADLLEHGDQRQFSQATILNMGSDVISDRCRNCVEDVVKKAKMA